MSIYFVYSLLLIMCLDPAKRERAREYCVNNYSLKVYSSGVVQSPLKTSSGAQSTRQFVLSGKATMLIPNGFKLMDRETLAIKYPQSGHQPTEVYTNKDGTINVALNHTKNQAEDTDLPQVKRAMDAQFNRSPINFIKSEIKELHGRKFIIMEFVSPAIDVKIYNVMAIASLEGRLVMITFNCIENYRKNWETTGKEVIQSIKIK